MTNPSQDPTQTSGNHKKRAGKARTAVVGAAAVTAALLAACSPGGGNTEATPRESTTQTTSERQVALESTSAYERAPAIVAYYAETVLDTQGKFKDAARFNSVTEDGKSKTMIVVPVDLKPGAEGDHGEYRISLTGNSNGDGLQASEVTNLQITATRSLKTELAVTGRENIDPVAGVAYVKTDTGNWELANWGENPENEVQAFRLGAEGGTQLSGEQISDEGILAGNATMTDQLLGLAVAHAPIGDKLNFS